MQQDASAPGSGLSLRGEWGTSEAVERQSQLTGDFNLLLQAEPRPGRIEIDLAGITSLDACGCQLLAVFLGNLERHGVASELCGIPPEIRAQINLLGFSGVFAPCAAREKENS